MSEIAKSQSSSPAGETLPKPAGEHQPDPYDGNLIDSLITNVERAEKVQRRKCTLTETEREEIINRPRTYRIVQSNRGKHEVVETGIPRFSAAEERAAELQRDYDAKHKLSTWLKDLFLVELENGDLINRALLERRFSRSEARQ